MPPSATAPIIITSSSKPGTPSLRTRKHQAVREVQTRFRPRQARHTRARDRGH
jgi:hypothetical protein